MNTKLLWNGHGYRLHALENALPAPLHWLYLPDGPGFGCNYLTSLATTTKALPGFHWLVDYPSDGSNRTHGETTLTTWQAGLLDLTQTLSPCVLVGHGFGGMLTLSIEDLEKHLQGLVLINSAPNFHWQSAQNQYHMPDFKQTLQSIVFDAKTDDTLKSYILSTLDYFFSEEEKTQGLSLLESMAFNYHTYLWGINNFHANYQAQWAPQTIPTLIISGEKEMLCPVDLFKQDPKFSRPNIQFEMIKGTSHFPWLLKQAEMTALLAKFSQSLTSSNSTPKKKS